jgi:N6-L-threonylcarbamoyladenine synthase
MTLVLGIETSCDETAGAIVSDGRMVVASVVASQVDLHRTYGGVFPEMASRQHVLDIVSVVEQTLRQAAVSWPQLDALAVTSGPGLVGSLLVGLNVAKAAAWAASLPIIGINHLEAHLYANWLSSHVGDSASLSPSPPPAFPLLCLIVSGGHTDLVLMTGHGEYRILGRTLDDASGEAFDKVARLLGLGYPGGPAIQRAAESGDPARFDLPRALWREGLNFSFSGLKTAVLRIVQNYGAGPDKQRVQRSRMVTSRAARQLRELPVEDLAASFQMAVVDVLVEKTRRAAAQFAVKEVLMAGGVASNLLLRREMSDRLEVPVRYPPPALCTDNAAMVAAAGCFKFEAGTRDDWSLDVEPGLGMLQADNE